MRNYQLINVSPDGGTLPAVVLMDDGSPAHVFSGASVIHDVLRPALVALCVGREEMFIEVMTALVDGLEKPADSADLDSLLQAKAKLAALAKRLEKLK